MKSVVVVGVTGTVGSRVASGTVEDFVRSELFAATVAAPTRGVGPGTTSGREPLRPTPEEVRQ
jgi:hypothetical protein